MRDILFRAKRADNGEWVEGFPIFDFADCSLKRNGKCVCEHNGELLCFYGWINELHEYNEVEVDPETVCQYTGLTDKNGRKIFEGDICKDGDNVVRILWNDKHQWGVEISKTDCILSKGLIFPLWQYDKCEENGNRELEVIGNIFDNPELIGE